MKIIAFSWTTPALLAGKKTVTRRDWKESTARQFKNGDLVQAYNRSQRNGGERVAYISLTQDPYLESTKDIPDSDFEAEGFKYLRENPVQVGHSAPMHFLGWVDYFERWRAEAKTLWVIRFELLP